VHGLIIDTKFNTSNLLTKDSKEDEIFVLEYVSKVLLHAGALKSSEKGCAARRPCNNELLGFNISRFNHKYWQTAEFKIKFNQLLLLFSKFQTQQTLKKTSTNTFWDTEMPLESHLNTDYIKQT
jgi:hypothetical protein